MSEKQLLDRDWTKPYEPYKWMSAMLLTLSICLILAAIVTLISALAYPPIPLAPPIESLEFESSDQLITPSVTGTLCEIPETFYLFSYNDSSHFWCDRTPEFHTGSTLQLNGQPMISWCITETPYSPAPMKRVKLYRSPVITNGFSFTTDEIETSVLSMLNYTGFPVFIFGFIYSVPVINNIPLTPLYFAYTRFDDGTITHPIGNENTSWFFGILLPTTADQEIAGRLFINTNFLIGYSRGSVLGTNTTSFIDQPFDMTVPDLTMLTLGTRAGTEENKDNNIMNIEGGFFGSDKETLPSNI